MFGPDKCGSENKIHFILRRFNPISKEHEEKHLVNTPMSRTGKLSTLYTLILKKNQDFEIRINGEVAKAGNLIQKPKLMKPPLTHLKKLLIKMTLNLLTGMIESLFLIQNKLRNLSIII